MKPRDEGRHRILCYPSAVEAEVNVWGSALRVAGVAAVTNDVSARYMITRREHRVIAGEMRVIEVATDFPVKASDHPAQIIKSELNPAGLRREYGCALITENILAEVGPQTVGCESNLSP